MNGQGLGTGNQKPVLFIVWLAILFSLMVYLLLAIYMDKKIQPTITPSQLLRLGVYLCLLIPVIGIIFARSELEKAINRREIGRVLFIYVVICAMGEFPAIGGLVWFFIAHIKVDFYVLWTVALVLLLLHPSLADSLFSAKSGSERKF